MKIDLELEKKATLVDKYLLYGNDLIILEPQTTNVILLWRCRLLSAEHGVPKGTPLEGSLDMDRPVGTVAAALHPSSAMLPASPCKCGVWLAAGLADMHISCLLCEVANSSLKGGRLQGPIIYITKVNRSVVPAY